jgi:exonuclease SbcC
VIIDSIHVKNFLSHKDTKVNFVDSVLWLVCGENGSGKSALFDAVEYALYGHHRGRKQNSELLIKQGERRATIEVVVRLAGRRYRVTARIGQGGNEGGQLEREDEALADVWHLVSLSGGRQAVWRWLEGRLPSNELFVSAIFLRQGHTAHFLRGDAGDRQARFARLVDLSQYSALGDRAHRRATVANTRIDKAQARLDELGDISDAALADIESRLEVARTELAAAEQRTKNARAVCQGAERHHALSTALNSLQQSRVETRVLLDDEATIRADAELVGAWDAAHPSIIEFRRQVKRATERRARHATAAAEILEAEEVKARLEGERNAASVLANAIEREELAEARRQVEQARTRGRQLMLEVGIAQAVDDSGAAKREAEQWAGKDAELTACRERGLALLRVQTLVGARATARERGEGVTKAEAALDETKKQLAAAEEHAGKLATSADQAIERRDIADRECADLATRVAHLTGRIRGHQALGGDEPECPVCAQTLDDAAHGHVREVLAVSTAELSQRETELETTRAELGVLKEQAATAAEAHRQATVALAQIDERLKGDQLRLAKARAEERESAVAVERAQADMAARHPDYVGWIERATQEWVRVEDAKLKSALHEAEKGTKALEMAKNKLAVAAATLKALRGQRESDAEPLGDSRSLDELREETGDAQAALESAETRLAKLTKQGASARLLVEQLGKEIVVAGGSIATARAEAKQAQIDAAESDNRAEEIRVSLGGRWEAAISHEDALETERQQIEQRRSSASRLTKLEQAYGAIDQLDGQIAATTAELGQIPVDHRIPLFEAQELDAAARTGQQNALTALAAHERDKSDVDYRRARSGEFGKEIDAANEEAGIFTTLSSLLKPNGSIQAHVAAMEQRRIATNVNQVLEKLGDPLRVSLGDPRRAGIASQDLVFLDTSGPIQQPRFFELLSGGEQFRVALSVALALHSRVGREPGTIVVDEGFGSLDSTRRDALAQQMADTTNGILGLGLAKSVIICSHSSEVQRHFPHRWLVIKQSGTATVERAELEDALAT